jgi:hypothetical protein
MKELRWSAEKSAWLKVARGLSFEEITRGRLLDVRQNPNRVNQQIILYEIDGYIWVVPFVEVDDIWFLKTSYPNRKYTREYNEDQL